jgi:RimJ/RimL family protein N-acetyltransferase
MDVEYLIEGERAALGPLRRDLAATYAAWINRVEVRSGLKNLGLLDRESEEAWIAETMQANAQLEPSAANFTIYDRSDGEPVGTCALDGISHRHRRANFGILLGERRGQGIGTEATRLTLDWAFNVLSLLNVLLEVYPWNRGAIRAYEKAGFRLIGRRRGALLHHGRRWDEIYMDAVASEFTGSVLAGRLPAREQPLD